MVRVCRNAIAATLFALVPGVAQAVPLVNPGFETGDLTGWDTSGSVVTSVCASTVIGCAPSGGTYFALLNDGSNGVGTSTLTQTAFGVGPGTYAYGAYVSFGTNNAPGNFAQGQISLTVEVPGGPSTVVGFDPNDLAGQFTIDRGDGFFFTPWFLLSGLVDYSGPGDAPFLLNINVQNGTERNALVLAADNAFISAVPEPATLTLLASGLWGMGVFAFRRRRKTTG